MAKPADDLAPRPERFEQPLDAIELVRQEPSEAAIAARLEAGESLEQIAASIAAARVQDEMSAAAKSN